MINLNPFPALWHAGALPAMMFLALLVGGLPGPAHGEILAEWQFEDDLGLPTSQTLNTGNVPGTWDADLHDTFATGTGHLRVRRAVGQHQWAHFDLGSQAITSGQAWAVLEIDAFSYSDGNNESIYLGFSHQSDAVDGSDLTLASSRFRRIDNSVYLRGQSYAGTNPANPYTTLDHVEVDHNPDASSEINMAHDDQRGSLKIATEVDMDDSTYTIYYKYSNESDWSEIGSDALAPGFQGNYVKLRVLHDHDGPGEFMDVNRIHVTTENPIFEEPEPEPLAGDLLGNGSVGGNDLDLVLGNWGADAADLPDVWANFRPSDYVGGDELDMVLGNWGASESTTAPEPGSLALLVVGGLLLLQRRR